MSIGGGFGKPMIRGLGFRNRIAYIEGSIKQEGQRWRWITAWRWITFEDSEVTVVKGSIARYSMVVTPLVA